MTTSNVDAVAIMRVKDLNFHYLLKKYRIIAIIDNATKIYLQF